MAAAPAVRIRLAAAEDVPAVLALLGRHGSPRRSTDDEEALRLAVGARAVLIATAEALITGTVIAGFDGWRGNLYRLTVHTDYRRLGVATAIVKAAERRLARRGCRRITILADGADAGASAFWERMGYRLDPDLVRAVKDLPIA